MLGLLYLPQIANAVMSSTNYTIFADDFNSGTVFNSSTYRLEGTVGESPVGNTTSTSYQIIGGYNAMDRSTLTLDVSSNSLDLGTLLSTSVSSASTNLTVSTDDSSGYTLSISTYSWSGTAMTDVADGTVTSGDEEYGFAITGDDINGALSGQDNAVSAVTLMSSSTSVTSSTGAVTFKASIGSGTAAGTRTQTITVSVSNNL